jgi:hypothetical protein
MSQERRTGERERQGAQLTLGQPGLAHDLGAGSHYSLSRPRCGGRKTARSLGQSECGQSVGHAEGLSPSEGENARGP